MKIALLALTDRGMITTQRIGDGLPNTVTPEFFIHEKTLSLGEKQRENHVQPKLHAFRRLGDVVPSLWQEYSVLIFVMATGIVVRQIASLIERKDRDPAVLVLDEEGKFVIPLLSGHLGGANSWANKIAHQIGAQAIITTATDGRGLVAPDEYARRYGWKVEPINHLPVVNSLLLEQGFLNVWTSYPLNPEHTWVKDSHYRFVSENEKAKANVILDAFPSTDIKEDCLYLIPSILSIGVGCRRGVSAQTILAKITAAVEQIGASLKAISGIYSIDLKSDEVGLIEAAKHLRVPFRTFRADELQAVNEQEHLSQSNFVNEKIGVDGVCEAASLLGAHKGRLILPKIMGQGVTVAISVENSLSWASDLETLTI
ncbi:cobalt-precorrin 5A hydrolase [Desulfosporosinus metallidurans]|uniref:Cobalamin biosynthesis protein CbiG n=1 Tax=Desulfosporosinus metallidurans TaxID=1888891 RepID=A0A1Q8QWM5_9FIRM|nr:cobalamin biosynthesis protein [Desulfosporosinus metallidurans]OLN31685.1 Cobalamin biosynthesis protein CbiG [Desulfosporosinus metallidurans]